MKNDLKDVLKTIRISGLTLRQIKLNFLWAFIYNLVLVPVAMGFLQLVPMICAAICGSAMTGDHKHFQGIKLDPMWAGCAMALSSVSVVLSSLSLRMWRL